MQTELGKLPLRAAESAFGERKKKRGETGKKNLRNENEQMQTRSKCKARESLGSRVVYSMPLRTRCASWRDQFAPERSSSWRVQVVARLLPRAPSLLVYHLARTHLAFPSERPFFPLCMATPPSSLSERPHQPRRQKSTGKSRNKAPARYTFLARPVPLTAYLLHSFVVSLTFLCASWIR